MTLYVRIRTYLYLEISVIVSAEHDPTSLSNMAFYVCMDTNVCFDWGMEVYVCYGSILVHPNLYPG